MESRAVFLACVFVTFVNTWLAFDRSYESVLAKRLVNPSPFEILDGTYRVWGILYAILGGGCLLWERRQGGFAYSLGLPVRQSHFNLIRGFVGVAQVMVIAFAPSYAAGWLHMAIRPEMQSPAIPSFSVMGMALAIAAFGLAYLAGSFVPHLYLAIGLSWILSTALSFLFVALPATGNLAPMALLRRFGALPGRPVDWLPVSLYALAGLLFIAAGAYVAERRPALRVP
jgi:hypothetical protein